MTDSVSAESVSAGKGETKNDLLPDVTSEDGQESSSSHDAGSLNHSDVCDDVSEANNGGGGEFFEPDASIVRDRGFRTFLH